MPVCPDNSGILSARFRNLVRELQELCPDNSRTLSGCPKNHQTLWLPLYSRLNAAFTTQTKDALVIDICIISSVQFIADPSVSHIRMVFVDLPDLLGDFLILFLAYAFWIFQPPIIRRARNVNIITEPFYWIVPFF